MAAVFPIVQHNYENIQRDNMTVYISPSEVHRMFTFTMEYQPFENECINQNVCERMLQYGDNILISNQEYIWQLYVRYLCTNGRINTLFNMLQHINTHFIEEQNLYNIDSFEMFLNRVDVPGFEGDTILDTFIMWNNDDVTIERLCDLGATTHIRYDNIINILHHRQWSNPFDNIMQIHGFPSFERNRIIQQPDIRDMMNNGIRIHNNASIQRHISHFYNCIIGLIRIHNPENNGQNYNEQEVLNQIIIINPEINNQEFQNNNIIVA